MTTLIYSLERNNIPFYIGKTRRSQTRFNSHKRNHKCEINIIDEVPTSEWKFWEKHYISLYKSWGFNLENKNNGGGGLTHPIFSKERNMKISISTKGRKISNEQKKIKFMKQPVTKTWLEARQFIKDENFEEAEKALDLGIMLVAMIGGKDKELIEGVKRETWLERFWITTENYIWVRRPDYEKTWRMR